MFGTLLRTSQLCWCRRNSIKYTKRWTWLCLIVCWGWSLITTWLTTWPQKITSLWATKTWATLTRMGLLEVCSLLALSSSTTEWYLTCLWWVCNAPQKLRGRSTCQTSLWAFKTLTLRQDIRFACTSDILIKSLLFFASRREILVIWSNDSLQKIQIQTTKTLSDTTTRSVGQETAECVWWSTMSILEERSFGRSKIGCLAH